VVRADNVARLRTKLVVQGANIPFTSEAEQICHERNILVVPDFIANAGGVICCAVEYRGGNRVMAFQAIEEKIRHNSTLVLEKAAKIGKLPRQVAVELAQQRVQKAMGYRHLISCAS
jgi:glutamate dehydrogenase (NAD(P)+)/glutamate dehydrogenase (NADP+)